MTARRRPLPPNYALGLALAEYDAGLLTLPGEPREHRYLGRPVDYVTQKLGHALWSKQREILQSVVDNRRTGVQSCHSAGKSFTVAQLVAYWLDPEVHDPGSAFVVTSAPSGPQVRNILWREIGKAHSLGRLPGRTTMTEWHMEVTYTGPSGVPVTKEEIVAFGRKPADYDPAAFQGIHAPYVLVILDEADGIPETLYHAARSLIANEDSRIVAIGNPDDPASYFCRHVLVPGSGWHVIHIDGLSSPNFGTDDPTDDELPDDIKAGLIGRTYVEEMRQDVGEGTPIWQSKVRGLVPESSKDGVVPLAWLKRCMQERDEPWPADDLLPVELGVDVGAGGDMTTVYERRGRVAGRKWTAATPDPSEACNLVLEAAAEAEPTAIKVDYIGVGWGIVGMLRQHYEGKRGAPVVTGVTVSQAALDPERFVNLRDQIWWDIAREFCRDAVWDLSGIDDATQAQLIAPQYKSFSGRYKVEKKDETRKRLGRSPDDADALLLSFFSPPPEEQEGVYVYDERVTVSPL